MKRNVEIRYQTFSVYDWNQSKMVSIGFRETCQGLTLAHAIDRYIKDNYQGKKNIITLNIEYKDLEKEALIDIVEKEDDIFIHDQFMISRCY